jgi:hypothetical protein
VLVLVPLALALALLVVIGAALAVVIPVRTIFCNGTLNVLTLNTYPHKVGSDWLRGDIGIHVLLGD